MKEGSLTDMQKNDWLTIMLEDKEGYFNHQQIKDSSFTFLVAGHETSAIGLTGVLLHLAEVGCISYVYTVSSKKFLDIQAVTECRFTLSAYVT